MAGNEILVDNPDEISQQDHPKGQKGQELVSWVVGTVGPWRDYRNRLPEAKRWAEYWRMWRGYWSESDKNRQSERSRLIAPALAQAIEMSVAEVEEALLSREVWFDVADDIQDEDKVDALIMRDLLREDMEIVNVKSAISESVTNAALFGTGIIKINVDTVMDSETTRDEAGELIIAEPDLERVIVTAESLRPDQFIPDPAGTSIRTMLGCGIDYRNKPVHDILEKIRQGTYNESALPFVQGITDPRTGDEVDFDLSVTVNDSDTDAMHVLEYHGKVPLFLLEKANGQDALVDKLLAEDFRADGDDGPLVEAIVTIGNESILLRAMVNPFVKTDRSVIAFPWEKVPGHFWGRGVSEKGYNPQKALDAELRARVDALGFVSAPMLGMDAGRIPRGFRPEIKPGKIWLTQGSPSEVLQPVGIGQVDPNTFNHTGELTQMVQMGTGAFDTSTTLRGSSQSGGNSATGGSMLLGAFVKRAKRAVQNVDRELVSPLIKTMALRYLQFYPTRYPFEDTKFVVKGSLGIVAREIEQLNITQLIGMLPEGAVGAKLAAAEGFIELSSAINKADIMKALEQDKESLTQQQQAEAESQQKIAELDQKIKELELESITLTNQKTIAEIRELMARAEVNERKADDQDKRTGIEAGKLAVQVADLENTRDQNEINEERLELQREQLELKKREANRRP
jgi:hypothetical protein